MRHKAAAAAVVALLALWGVGVLEPPLYSVGLNVLRPCVTLPRQGTWCGEQAVILGRLARGEEPAAQEEREREARSQLTTGHRRPAT